MQLTGNRFPTLLNLFLLTSGLWKLRWPRFFGRYQMTGWARDSERDLEVISGCYLMVRREVIERVGPLDDRFFFYGEETDWCRRIADDGWILRFAPVGEIVHHGEGAAKALSYRRDILLTGALIELQRKHEGPTAAFATRWMLLAFNLSRAVYWSILAAVSRRPGHIERSMHFRRITASSMSLRTPVD